MDLNEDLHCLLSEQRRELAAAEAMESDLDFAFRLQLQEALAASLAVHPSSSSSTAAAVEEPVVDDEGALNATALQREELARTEREMKDRDQSEKEMQKIREDLCRRIHDQKVASEILTISEVDWQQWGDNFEKPFGEGSSSSGGRSGTQRGFDEDSIFRVYFTGLVSGESVRGQNIGLAGIGVAICDPANNLIFEVSKSLLGNGTSKIAAELKALIEAFNAAITLDLKRVAYYCDYYPLFQFVRGKWPVKQRKVAKLVDQVNLLQSKFTYCNPRLVARHDVKFAFKLARDAIVSQSMRPGDSGSKKNLNETCVICLEDTNVNQFKLARDAIVSQSMRPGDSGSKKNLNETCVICLEDTNVNQIFSVDGCQHRYCFSCMRQHVEVKLLHGMVPKCPHEGCNHELLLDSCRKFLTHKLVATMQQRKLEASIPVTEKIYCPYPRCSALMSKSEVLEYSKNLIGESQQSGPKKCIKCHGLFCFSCKVPWHSGMTCSTYKRLNPNPPAEDLKLKFLASRSLWRQCVKCNHMIELAEGCYHMTCRCGYEFCYNCGAEWKEKKATCTCPLWAEDNIWLEDHSEEEEEEDEDDDDYYNSDYSDDFY
ncbi:uncharacterized protein LOC113858620 [Abrus precatorius]|uniref:RBR-type E3 ubiquitin transferase n=1 Tax=Abrus precatorius TaxID=3816 RepID=A0A8B8KUX2_ABRPR|nr:uncharacterized protein LOC113858620 [Abrus precatorius]